MSFFFFGDLIKVECKLKLNKKTKLITTCNACNKHIIRRTNSYNYAKFMEREEIFNVEC